MSVVTVTNLCQVRREVRGKLSVVVVSVGVVVVVLERFRVPPGLAALLVPVPPTLALFVLALLSPMQELLSTRAAEDDLDERALLLAVFGVRERDLELGEGRGHERRGRLWVGLVRRGGGEVVLAPHARAGELRGSGEDLRLGAPPQGDLAEQVSVRADELGSVTEERTAPCL